MRRIGGLYSYANLVIEACWLVLAALVPLYVDLLRARTELPKELFLELIVVLMALLWGAQRVAVRWAEPAAPPAPRAVPRYFVAAAAAYVAVTLGAAWLSPLPEVAFGGSYVRGGGAWATAAYAVLFLIVADRLRTSAQLARLLRVLLAASVPVCLYALAQAAQLDPLGWGERDVTRVFGTLGNAPAFAAYLGLLLPLTIWRLREAMTAPAAPGRATGLWLTPRTFAAAVGLLAVLFAAAAGRQQGWWLAPALIAAFALLAAVLPPIPAQGDGPLLRRVGYGALLLLQALVLGLTEARGPIAGLVVAALVTDGVAAWLRRQRRRVLIAAGVLLALGGMLLILNATASPVRALAENVPLLRRLSNLTTDYTPGRLLVWRAGLGAFGTTRLVDPDNPRPDPLRWLLGYGPETIQYQLDRVLPPASLLDDRIGEFWDRTHNELLDQLLTTGLCGLVAYVALIGGIVGYVLHRALRPEAGQRGSLGVALAVAVLGYAIAVQVGLGGGGATTVFWLVAGVAVGEAWLAPAPDPAVAVSTAGRGRAARGVGAGPRGPARRRSGERAAASGWRFAALAAYGGLAVAGALVLFFSPAPGDVLLATCVQLLAVGLAPFVGALALGSGPPGRPALVLAGGVAAIALPLTLLLGRYQVATLAADAAFRRAQVAEPAADFVVAIRATQDAIALVPRQSEYYSLLGQYYGALAPRATGSELPDFVAAPATATSLRQPTQLSRDQVFDLGRVSLETAIQLNPLDVRFHTTLGQLYRYWDETAGTTAHLAAAQAQFEAATRLKPNDVEGHVGAADVRLQAGDYADALVRAEHARTLMPTYWYPYEVMARAHMALHQYPEAYAAADDAIQRGSRWGLGFKAPTQADVSRLTALRREAAELGGGPPGA